MPTLNYGDTQDDTQGSVEEKIIRLISADNKITTDEMSKMLKISSSTVKRKISKMTNVIYVGSGYSGHWEIIG